METKIARPVDSHKGAARAHISHPVAAKRPQIWERNIVRTGNGSSSPNARPYARAAPIATRSMETTNGSNIAAPGPSRRPTSSAPLPSRPGVTSGPARNFSRPQQGISGTCGATPISSRPNLRGHAVREVGFENWATRHESIAAHPVRAPRGGRVRRVCSVVLEEDEDGGESDVLPAALPAPPKVKTGEMGARRSPGLVVHARAAPIRSEVASLVAATESVRPPLVRHSWLKPRPHPHPAVLPLRHSVGHVPPRTYMDMHARYERAPTRLMPKSWGAALDFGENCSPWSAGTTVRDVRRRAALGLRVPLPGNEVEMRGRGRGRVFRGEFVDVPVWIGRGREGRGRVCVEERERESERGMAGGSEVVPAPLEGEGGERKKGWQRVSAFLARRMGRKEKGAAPSPSPETPSPRTPSLVYDGPSSTPSPARAPATPPQVHFAAPVVISGPPYSPPRKATAERKSTSPPKTALKRTPPQPCSPFQLQKEQQHPAAPFFAHAIASASAFPLRETPSIAEEEEKEEEQSSLPLEVDDAEIFPSPALASQRWSQPQPQPSQESLHEAVADALAEEIAEADWSGALLKRAESVQYVGKGKGRVVDVRGRPARYHGRRVVAEASGLGGEGEGKARRDTVVVPGAWPVSDGEEMRRPVVAISGLR